MHLICSGDCGVSEREGLDQNNEGGLPRATKPHQSPHFWSDCLLPTVKRRWAGDKTAYITRDYLDSCLPDDNLASPWGRVTEVDTETTSDFISFASVRAKKTILIFICRIYAHIVSVLLPQGLDLFRSGGEAFDTFEEDYFHGIVEECDRPSGFCLLADSDNGFAGVALRLGDYLCEEFTKRPVLTYAVAGSQSLRLHCSRRSTALVALNRMALYSGLESTATWASCSAWAPLCAPLIEATAPCPVASQLAAAITTAMTPLSLSSDQDYAAELNGFINSLTPTRKKVNFFIVLQIIKYRAFKKKLFWLQMLSLTVSTSISKTPFSHNAKWNHLNTLALDIFESTRNSKHIVDTTYPESFTCHLSSLGVTEKSQALYEGGHSCTLGQGVDVRLVSHLPNCPLTVPRAPSTSSPCTQPTFSRSCSLLEAVSHWTNKNQWLALGLEHHMTAAFGTNQNQLQYAAGGLLEADELKEKKENAVHCLLDAYSSPDT